MPSQKKLLFLVTEDWYFHSHRLSHAIAAQAAGFEVIVATKLKNHKEEIESFGIRTIPLKQLRRSSLNPFCEILTILELVLIYKREKPDLVHQVSLKPVVYGTLAAWISGVPFIVNALAGLGFIFSSKKFFARLLKPLLIISFRFFLNSKNGLLIIQNNDDKELILKKKIVDSEYIRLISGAGVDLERYIVNQIPKDIPLIILASRMLWDKGVGEFVAAAKILKEKGLNARFVLVGDTDTENPTSIPREQLSQWQHDGVIEWWGYRSDMPEVLSSAHVVCLPSFYGEGIPKVLIEAMACARPIITTDMPGCRELVRDGKNGIIIAPRNVENLADALSILVNDRSTCVRMGLAGREIAESEYSLPRIVSETLGVYKELLT